MCIICEEITRESVFVPCGHRCCCFKCATNAFDKFKKCPLCQAICTCILKKVYD